MERAAEARHVAENRPDNIQIRTESANSRGPRAGRGITYSCETSVTWKLIKADKSIIADARWRSVQRDFCVKINKSI
jgi:hypothetical protein